MTQFTLSALESQLSGVVFRLAFGISRELVRRTGSWVPPRPSESNSLEMRPRELCFNKPLRDAGVH